MCVCVLCVCVCVCVCMYMCMSLCVCKRKCVCVCKCMCACVCLCVCVNACVHVCVCVYMHMCVYLQFTYMCMMVTQEPTLLGLVHELQSSISEVILEGDSFVTNSIATLLPHIPCCAGVLGGHFSVNQRGEALGGLSNE